MRYERLIARKFLQKDGKSFSQPLVGIATWGIALGVMVMLMAIAILQGFQKEIEQKIVGFGSHIVVKSQDIGHYYEEIPVANDRPVVATIRQMPEVAHVQFFANKGGMAKTDDQIQGIIFKGVDAMFDSSFFAQNLVEGRLFQLSDTTPSNEIIVSQTLANKLNLSLNDKLRSYFWQDNNYRGRAFQIVGIYNTDLAEFDEHYVVGDLRQVQVLNGWKDNEVAGYEVMVKDFDKLNEVARKIYETSDYDLTLTTIVEANESLFAWLDILNSNIALILTVMAIVCCVAIVSALLIMIFEKTAMIGLLKTLGASNKSIRRIFLYKSAEIAGKGILWGDLIALVLCVVQKHFQIIRLDSASYSMSHVPIDINAFAFIAISVCTLAICLLVLLIPASYIAHIQPSKTLRFE